MKIKIIIFFSIKQAKSFKFIFSNVNSECSTIIFLKVNCISGIYFYFYVLIYTHYFGMYRIIILKNDVIFKISKNFIQVSFYILNIFLILAESMVRDIQRAKQ